MGFVHIFCLLPHLEDNCMKEKMFSVLFTALITTRNISWPVHSRHLVNIERMNVLGPNSAYLPTFWALPFLILPLILCLCPCHTTWRLERNLTALLCIAMPWPSEFLMANLDRDGNIIHWSDNQNNWPNNSHPGTSCSSAWKGKLNLYPFVGPVGCQVYLKPLAEES